MPTPILKDALIRLVGWKATLFHGDTLVYDRWKWLRDHLKAGPVRTLDAGCGSGVLSFYAAASGNSVTGVDFGGRNIESARRRAEIMGTRNINFVEADMRQLEKFREQLGTFDQIVCFEAIEHIQNDQKLVDNLAALLKPGGRLILTTPFKYYRHMVGDALSEKEDGGHVRWGYTHEEIRAILMRAGLKVVVQDYMSGMISQQVTNALRLLSRINSRIAWGLTFPLRLLRPMDPTLTKLAHYPFFSLGVVAVKNSTRA